MGPLVRPRVSRPWRGDRGELVLSIIEGNPIGDAKKFQGVGDFSQPLIFSHVHKLKPLSAEK